MPYQLLALVIVLAASVWVFVDAETLGARKGSLGGGLLDMGPGSWCAATLLLWIIAFPCYLLTRPKLVRVKAERDAQRSTAIIAPTHPQPQAPPYSQVYAQAYGLPYTPAAADGAPPVPQWSEPLHVPSSRSVQLAGVAAIVAVLGLGGLSAAHTGADPAPKTTPVAAADPTSSAATPLDADLTQLTLRSTDFTGGYHVELFAAGDQVRGQVTLDNCGYRFTTESARVARRQVAVVDNANEHTGVSDEIVAYRSAAQAAAALRQWHEAAAHCPRGPVHSAVAGVPDFTEHVLRDSRNVSVLPVAKNAVTVERLASAGVETSYLIAVLQQHGRLLDAIYSRQRGRPVANDVRVIERLATITGRRLAQR